MSPDDEKATFNNEAHAKMMLNDVTTGNAAEIAAITLFLRFYSDNNPDKRDYNSDKRHYEALTDRFVAYPVQEVGEDCTFHRSEWEENFWPPYAAQIELLATISCTTFQASNQ